MRVVGEARRAALRGATRSRAGCRCADSFRVPRGSLVEEQRGERAARECGLRKPRLHRSYGRRAIEHIGSEFREIRLPRELGARSAARSAWPIAARRHVSMSAAARAPSGARSRAAASSRLARDHPPFAVELIVAVVREAVRIRDQHRLAARRDARRLVAPRSVRARRASRGTRYSMRRSGRSTRTSASACASRRISGPSGIGLRTAFRYRSRAAVQIRPSKSSRHASRTAAQTASLMLPDMPSSILAEPSASPLTSGAGSAGFTPALHPRALRRTPRARAMHASICASRDELAPEPDAHACDQHAAPIRPAASHRGFTPHGPRRGAGPRRSRRSRLPARSLRCGRSRAHRRPRRRRMPRAGRPTSADR